MSNSIRLWPTIKRLLSYGAPWKKSLCWAVVMLWVAAGSEVLGSVLISCFIDQIDERHMPFNFFSGVIIISYLLLQVFAALLYYWQALWFNQIAVGVVQHLRTNVMDAALRQPLSAFDTQPVGQIISRVTNDTEVVRDLYVTVVSTALRSAALVGSMLIAMFTLNWRMALMAITIFPAVLTVMLIYQRHSTPIVRRLRSCLADINNGFNEVINGMSIIQQFRQQDRFGKRMGKASHLHYRARMDIIRLEGFLLRPLLSLFSALILCGLMMLYGCSSDSTIEVGILYAFINYLSRLNEPLIEITTQQSILQQAAVAGERIFELMDSPCQPYGKDIQPLSGGKIDIFNLTFSYRSGYPVLKKINISIPERHFVALVGQTGSGKSTLANLLMGYYPLSDGEIYLDSRSISSLSHSALRNSIAMVQQDPVVLADTLFSNVSLGRDITEQAVWDVLSAVQLDDLARSMPQGIFTELGEQGNCLSIGQKQLLAIARVLVIIPQILILDEATANIDSGTEQAIQKALCLVRQHTTLVVIAHRLSTIIEADTILVLHRGQIVEKGNHQTLLAMRGRYWQMYRLQLVSAECAIT
ncbi:SmdB family multidrug efflux ABC transporter permease/ATP-binding protein [Candidatus Erwinia haradaeae]|uniref:Multidrug resistance-like ATP-binding protein MdlB n=1 Tax=Candidatus Erwinia haradaeae TaxID=1922217 RepID=A0A451DNQ7_9GAMM|nr:SmdB family multidrug efflux ABC transporter permease/ATP-binding protein [Candidatus Erwinia haradaeae]VFP88405.1 Multidrug resistance-like ATP-binding protein MdlB [Candidatus Erwinia haradaeae]